MQQRKVYWPLFFYFYCKYSPSFNLVMNVTTKISCQALVRVLVYYQGSIPLPFVWMEHSSHLANLQSTRPEGRQWLYSCYAPSQSGIVPLWWWSHWLQLHWDCGVYSYTILRQLIRGSWNDAIDMCVTTSGISGLMGSIIFMYGESCMVQNDMLNTNVEYSDVVWFTCSGPYNYQTAQVSWSIFTVPPSFPAGDCLFSHRIHRLSGAYHLPLSTPRPCESFPYLTITIIVMSF